MRKRFRVSVGGIEWSPASHAIVFSTQEEQSQQAASLLSQRLKMRLKRYYQPIPDSRWLMNQKFHELSKKKGTGGDLMSETTQARIPILIGKSDEMLKILGISSPSASSTSSSWVKLEGASLLLLSLDSRKESQAISSLMELIFGEDQGDGEKEGASSAEEEEEDSEVISLDDLLLTQHLHAGENGWYSLSHEVKT